MGLGHPKANWTSALNLLCSRRKAASFASSSAPARDAFRIGGGGDLRRDAAVDAFTSAASLWRPRHLRHSARSEMMSRRTPRDKSGSSFFRQTKAPRPRVASFSDTEAARRRMALDSDLDGRAIPAVVEAARGFAMVVRDQREPQVKR
ncbi:hypothetical protein E2562_009453 [Oryza meyeriana var. granulata]|uniref:Uncharacterized protein n=1 Tax=Oryza meyeriana var. granulata TaxID=110450 RepID=A0A6G1BTR7_9ORYZ|nr:hypothetical protein E2562_009453 [Oryza meyeriana var. granulata]